MKTLLCTLAAAALSSAIHAQNIDQPAVKGGDTWRYRVTHETGPNGWNQTHEDLTVDRVSSSAIYFDVKQQGSTQAPNHVYMGLDWSRVRNVNGTETLVNRPLAFPLAVGKAWEVNFDEQNPNRRFKSEKRSRKYKVLGYETVEVPAGTFKAIKVESEGQWVAELAPTQNVVQGGQTGPNGASMVTQVQTTPAGTKVMGRSYAVLWYAPEVKRWVKSVEDDYDSGGARNSRSTVELESFKVSD